jgi:coproporphyrinogen III oxidase-like Fe-S oxidoreductase
MSQELYKKEFVEIYNQITSNEYSNAAFSFFISKIGKTRIDEIYKIIKKEPIEPRINELINKGLFKKENGFIEPTELGLLIHKLFSKKLD